MKIGIIGCGSISQVHGWVLTRMEDSQIDMVCDIEEERAVEFAAKFGGPDCRVVTDWHILCESGLDIVHVCTPHYLHAPMAAGLLKSGKAVFMEKPVAVSREQYALLAQADNMHPGKLGICFQNRYNATTQTTDRLIAEGRIGEVTGARAFVTWRRDEAYYAGSPWKGRKETEGGGALINQAIHTLDLMLRYLGKPDEVEASVSNHHLKGVIEVEDTVEAWMSFPHGKRACFYASNGYATDAPVILEIQGDKGRITICDLEVTLWTQENGPEHIICEETKGIGKGYWGAGHLACIRDFYDSVREGKEPKNSLKSAEVTFDTMMRIYVHGTWRLNMEQVRLGIIGIGGMGTNHANSLIKGEVPDIRLTAVADISADRRKFAKEHFPEDIRIFSTGEELIDSGACDAVLIATPHYFHPDFVIYALEHGVHALSEKPAGVYTKQVRKMNEVAAKSDKVFAIMLNQRTNCVYRKLHEMIGSGELGELKRVNWIITDWYRTQSYYDAAGWKATWDGEGGGVLLNQCPHQLDLLQWLCGMPVKVRAFCSEAKWHDIEVEDDVTAYLEYANGATGVFVTTTGDAPGTNRLELTFEMGKIVCEGDKLIFYRLSENERLFCKTCPNGFQKPEMTCEEIATDGKNEQHTGVLKAFADRILRGGKLVAEGTEGINGLTLSNAMYLSSWLDKTVGIPFDEDLFLEELNKRRARSKKKEGTGVVFDTTGTY